MNNFEFNGVITALVTPFKKNKLDLETFEALLLKQIESKINAILLFGTTGEGLSLSLTEKSILFKFAKTILPKTLPIICGISEVSTDNAIRQARLFERWKANGLLVITPYYYKTTDEGVFNHFESVAKSVNLPIIIYNVPQRTGYDLMKNPSLLNKLFTLKNIVAVKHCPSDNNDCKNALSVSKIPLLCGTDSLILNSFQLGYAGCISVISNCFPKTVCQIYNAVKENDFEQAKLCFNKIKGLLSAFETSPNPISVKYTLSRTFNCSSEARLPLAEANQTTKQLIDEYFDKKEI